MPGVAFDHPSGGGPLIPRLTHVKALWVVSSTGAPWWVTRLYMGDPVRRQFARGIKPLAGRKASFRTQNQSPTKTGKLRRSAIDGRTTRHAGFRLSNSATTGSFVGLALIA